MFILVSFTLFFIGLIGIFMNRKNILIVLLSVELALLAINVTLITTSSYLDDNLGQIFALFVVTIAAAESSIGLAILIVYYRLHGTISIETIRALNG